MAHVAVRGVDSDAVAEVLESDCGVDDEALGAADAEVGVEEDYRFGGFVVGGVRGGHGGLGISLGAWGRVHGREDDCNAGGEED